MIENDREPLLAPIRGRGSSTNPANRFDPVEIVIDRDAYDASRDEQNDPAGLDEWNQPARRHVVTQPRVPLHQQADDKARRQLNVRQVVGAKGIDDLRPGDRFQDVVGGHRQEGIAEHQRGDCALALA